LAPHHRLFSYAAIPRAHDMENGRSMADALPAEISRGPDGGLESILAVMGKSRTERQYARVLFR